MAHLKNENKHWLCKEKRKEGKVHSLGETESFCKSSAAAGEKKNSYLIENKQNKKAKKKE